MPSISPLHGLPHDNHEEEQALAEEGQAATPATPMGKELPWPGFGPWCITCALVCIAILVYNVLRVVPLDVAFCMDFLLGGCSGAIAKTLTAPIERIKLVVQTQDANEKIRSREVPRYKGIFASGRRIYREQGFWRFWDGNLANCVRCFPTQAFGLAFKEKLKGLFPRYDPKLHFALFFLTNLVSGGLGAAGSLTIVYPLDYARTRLASDVGTGRTTFRGLGDCVYRTATGPGGVMALYTGFAVSVVGIVGYRGLELGCFDSIVGLNPWREGLLGAVSTFAAAQLAVTVAACCTYPLDTVRRRMQMQSEKATEDHVYSSSLDCFRKIAREEGLRKGLYQGFWANVLRGVGSALVLLLYDRAKAQVA